MKRAIKKIIDYFLEMHLLKKVIVIWLSVELVAIISILFVIPDHFLLRWYLPEQSIESTQKFLDKKSYLIPDDITGWRNKPNVSKENWVIDEHGSRGHRTFGLNKDKPLRVIFVGSSMINGGTHIKNTETISAYLESDEVEALNFGVMLYSLDQSYLLYKNYLQQFKPDIIVVGLDTDPVSGLKNIYIPFRSRKEVNMPYMKPRFLQERDQINLIEPDIKGLHGLLDKELPANIEKYDGFYTRFEGYKFNLLPISSLFSFFVKKYHSLQSYFIRDVETNKLLLNLMKTFVLTADKQGTKVFFVSIPGRSIVSPGRIRSMLPDIYADRINTMRDANLPLFDARNLLSQYKDDLGKYYAADNAHLSADGNQLIARYLQDMIDEL